MEHLEEDLIGEALQSRCDYFWHALNVIATWMSFCRCYFAWNSQCVCQHLWITVLFISRFLRTVLNVLYWTCFTLKLTASAMSCGLFLAPSLLLHHCTTALCFVPLHHHARCRSLFRSQLVPLACFAFYQFYDWLNDRPTIQRGPLCHIAAMQANNWCWFAFNCRLPSICQG